MIDPDWQPNETLDDQFDRVGRNPLTWACPACQAPPGRPCSAPTDSGRRDVDWFHNSRIDLANGWD